MTRLLTIALVAAAVLYSGCKGNKDSKRGNPAKTAAEAEARKNLLKIAKATKAYFSKKWTDKNGVKLDPQFPVSVSWTPEDKVCADGKKQFESNERTWRSPTWNELRFQLSGEHYAQYKVISKGTSADARTTILARIDPKCDSRGDVFTLTVAADPDTIYTKATAIVGKIEKH